MKHRVFVVGFLLGCLGHAAAADPTPPALGFFRNGGVELRATGRLLLPGDEAGAWTLMSVTKDDDGRALALFEDFSSPQGSLAIVDQAGKIRLLSKSLESTWVDPATLYHGHSLKQVRDSDQDLLGREILADPDDPSYAAVAASLAPIIKLDPHSFVGTPHSPDKIGISYGGRTGNFDPAVHVPAIRKIRDEGRVQHGLVGGWQPVLRFVYPESPDDWSEMILFAPMRTELANPRIQPVWYRVCRIEGNRLKWAKYFDSYPPFPPRLDGDDPSQFYRDLLGMTAAWEQALSPAIRLELPDDRLANQARHSLVRAMMTRVNDFPKYGVLDRNYGGAEHDGFQDTFNVDTTAMLEWGLFDRARAYIDNYLTHFVRDDGSLLYRGPGTGQYGRMLTVLAQYARYTGDHALLLQHRKRIDAIAQLLLALRRTSQALPEENAAHGMIAGWCEADSCLEADPDRYHQPYFSNSAEAARGFADLGAVWQDIGKQTAQADLDAWGAKLCSEADELRADLAIAMQRSRLTGHGPDCIPAIAGAKLPPHIAAARDGSDPQFRAYRTYMEMLFSGVLPRADVATIVRYRENTRDTILGVPTAYGYNTGELVGFLSYGHAYGLLQHDFIRQYLLTLYSLSAHHYTRGTWTAPETRLINPDDRAAPYAVPAQLTVPLLVRWMLVFEDPMSETLWLGKALPREWLADGKVVSGSNLPTRWGRVDFRITSRLAEGRIEAELELPEHSAGLETKLRLRAPDSRRLISVLLDGKPWPNFDADTETIMLPSGLSGKVLVSARY